VTVSSLDFGEITTLTALTISSLNLALAWTIYRRAERRTKTIPYVVLRMHTEGDAAKESDTPQVIAFDVENVGEAFASTCRLVKLWRYRYQEEFRESVEISDAFPLAARSNRKVNVHASKEALVAFEGQFGQDKIGVKSAVLARDQSGRVFRFYQPWTAHDEWKSRWWLRMISRSQVGPHCSTPSETVPSTSQ